jgi:hypothetical protein
MHIRPGKSVCSRLYRAFAHTARLASSSGAMTSTSIASSWAALAVMGSFDPIMATTRCASSASVVLWVLEAMSARRGYSLSTRSACRPRAIRLSSRSYFYLSLSDLSRMNFRHAWAGSNSGLASPRNIGTSSSCQRPIGSISPFAKASIYRP